MKKIFVVFLSLCLCFFAFGTTNISALDSTDENTHLFGPTAVCATDDKVFVADKNNDQNVLYIFDQQGYVTKNLSGVATRLAFADGKVFALLTDKIEIFDITADTKQTVVATGAKDIATHGNLLFCVFDCGIGQFDVDMFDTQDIYGKNLVATGTNISGVAHDGTNLYYVDNGILFKKSSGFEVVKTVDKNSRLAFADNTLFVYDNDSINEAEIGFEICDLFAVSQNKIFVASTNDFSVKSLRFENGALLPNTFILGTNHKNYDTGFDTVDSFEKLALCTTNKVAFVYGAENGDETNNRFGFVDQNTTMIKLSETNGFAYVLYTFDNVQYFGFVDMDDLTFANDPALNLQKVTITSNQRIYTLPVDKADYMLKQDGNVVSVSNTQQITVLAEIAGFDNDKWVFAKVGDNFGFVIKAKLKNPPVVYPVYQFGTANPPIGKNLEIYQTADSSSQVVAKVASGTEIKVFETVGDYSKVSINVDGQRIEGWAKSSFIVKQGKMTNTVSLGLVVGITLVLVIGFLITWRYLHKKKKYFEQD
ncbi:MAG: SH3 domain-containing protein [Clostridia bacterium]|nr:SH3 domain-containing protein [Clostridia bacterium]